MNLILNYPNFIIEKMQALIRGFLCRRRFLRSIYNKCICDIIFSPPNYFIKNYIGGIEYYNFKNRYN